LIAALASVAFVNSPAFAATPATSAPVAAPVATWPVAGAVDRFYAMRGNVPLWMAADSSAREALLAALRSAPLDGLAAGPELAAQVEGALAAASSGKPDRLLAADRLMSAAWATYVRTLRRPVEGMIYGDQAVTASPPSVERILADAIRSKRLADHVRAVSAVNPVYARLREAAALEMARTGTPPSAMILANLDRARPLPATGRFVLVDAASQTLWMYDNGEASGSMKVIVGKPEYATPMIASMIYYATVNPYWHVPDHLVRKTIAPGVLKQGAAYLTERGYEIVSDWNDDGATLSPAKIDWKAAAEGRVEVKVRQKPGGSNAMGDIKFQFANGAGIYLHDTPDKALFAKDQRTLSNGCVRLEDAPRLARWMMGSVPVASGSTPEQHVAVPGGVPVYITYLTARAEAGQLTYRDDVYGRDSAASARVAALR
jgi:murein L,D-transpeptidase YcbB/YkuD